MHARAEKNFVCVNIANARDELLVQQDRFHRAMTFPQDFLELSKIEIECVRAERAFF